MASRATVAIGLGSNVGHSRSYLMKATEQLPLAGLRLSWLYESEALLPPGAPSAWNLPFLNLVAVGETDQDPLGLLREIKIIEQRLGRKDRGRWAPREIDIDILGWESLVLNLPQLQIPHPGLLDRPFALLPFAEAWPSWIYPGAGTAHGVNISNLSEKWTSAGVLVPFGTKRTEPLK